MYSHYTVQPQSQNSFDPPGARYRSLSCSVPSSPTTSVHSNPPVHPSPDISNIGRPSYFLTGPHTGKTIRMKLVEIQKADLGRKYAKVDRRPLDPPPVVHLKIYEVQENASPHGEIIEVEVEYDETQLLGLLCTVDLFPAPAADIPSLQGSRANLKSTSAPPTKTKFFPSPSPSSPGGYGPEIIQYQYDQAAPMNPPIHALASEYVQSTVGTSNIVHYSDGFPITEDSKQTQALVGATFVQPAIIDYQGKKAIVFVFSDLAVKIEGTFLLRYRVFDIFGKQADQALGQALSVTAETYGGTFRVYSTKEFPGLSASTELTKLLARWGVRLNIRETERRRRKRGASEGTRGHTPEHDD